MKKYMNVTIHLKTFTNLISHSLNHLRKNELCFVLKDLQIWNETIIFHSHAKQILFLCLKTLWQVSLIPNGIYVFTHENHLKTHPLSVHGNQPVPLSAPAFVLRVTQRQSYQYVFRWSEKDRGFSLWKDLGKKSRKENNGNKQIEEESVVRKSVRQQPEDGRGRDQEESKGQWKAS